MGLGPFDGFVLVLVSPPRARVDADGVAVVVVVLLNDNVSSRVDASRERKLMTMFVASSRERLPCCCSTCSSANSASLNTASSVLTSSCLIDVILLVSRADRATPRLAT